MNTYRIVENNDGEYQLQQMQSGGNWRELRLYLNRHSNPEWYDLTQARQYKASMEKLENGKAIKRVVE